MTTRHILSLLCVVAAVGQLNALKPNDVTTPPSTTDSTLVKENPDAPLDLTTGRVLSIEDEDLDFPARYLDADQNRLPDGSSTAVVARLRRGDTYLVPDTLFYKLKFLKHFPQKRFMDRLMIDVGAGGQLQGARDLGGWRRSSPRPNLQLGFADWITPEHGIHVGWELGVERLVSFDTPKHSYSSHNPFYMGASIDYWANLNALANTHYDRPKTLEIYGVAGLDLGAYKYTCVCQDYAPREFLVGGHIGMRAVINMRRDSYLYMEPRVTFYRPGAHFRENVGDGYGLQLGLTAGMGFRRDPAMVLATPASRKAYRQVDGHGFLTLAAGLSSPVRVMARQNLGATGRISFGRWFWPYAAWRVNAQGWAYVHEIRTWQRAVRATMGPDLMLDATALLLGYSERRIVHVRPYAGVNLGASYAANTGGRLKFETDVHFGIQAALRVHRSLELFLEPQGSLLFDGPRRSGPATRVHATGLAGLNYRLNSRTTGRTLEDESTERRQFVTGAVGTGCNTTTVNTSIGLKRRFTIDADVAYGQWFRPESGWRVGIGNSNFNMSGKKEPRRRRDVMYVHADYMLDLLSMSFNRNTRTDLLELYAIIGAHYALVQTSDISLGHGAGIQAGMHIGCKVSPSMSLYLEPTVQISSSKAYHTGHPIDGAGRVFLGIQYAF